MADAARATPGETGLTTPAEVAAPIVLRAKEWFANRAPPELDLTGLIAAAIEARDASHAAALLQGWREFRRLLVIGGNPIGRFDDDGAVAVLRPDKFAELLQACEGKVLGEAQCSDCSDCRGTPPVMKGTP